MKNIMKMQFFIAYKSKIWWILGLVAACFISFFTIMVHYSSDGMINSPEDVNVSMVQTNVIEHKLSLVQYCEQIVCSDILLMFVTIFSILVILQELRNGYIKNVWVNLDNKWHFLLAKILIVMSYVLFLFMIMFAVILLLDTFLLKTEEVGNVKELLKICIVQYYLEVVFATVFMSIALALKKVVPALACGIVYVSVANVLICGVVDLVINKSLELEKNFELENYLVYGNIMKTTLNAGNDTIIHAICVATIWGLVAMVVSNLLLKKRNIL